MLKKFKTTGLVVALSSVLVACGGGGDDSPGNSKTPNQASTIKARFVDSAVLGLEVHQEGYAGKSGVQVQTTDKNGEFYFSPNSKKVVFKVANLTVGEAVLDEKSTQRDKDGVILVTPTTIAKDTEHETKILQVLQTLDKDNNPSNGIEIDRDPSAQKLISKLPNLSLSQKEASVEEVLKNVVLPSHIVLEAKARQHYEETIAKLKKEIAQHKANKNSKVAVDALVGSWKRGCKKQATNSYDIATFTFTKVSDSQVRMSEEYETYDQAGCTGPSKAKTDPGDVYSITDANANGSTITALIHSPEGSLPFVITGNTLKLGATTYTRISR